MLQLEGVSKVFRTSDVETTALNNVNLSIAQGDFVSIMGPSGCGKSTLLNVLGMLDSPTSGHYYFDDNEVTGLSERGLAEVRKKNLGFVFQSFNLIDDLSVFENVELVLLYQNVPPAQRKERVNRVLEKVNIAQRSNHLPQELSGGQQQRVAVARALVGNPKLILADEPTGNLDSANGEHILTLLSQLNSEGTTIVMVTHSQNHAEYAQRIISLLDGQILTENIISAKNTPSVATHSM